jgi:hypothetical protein
MPRCSLRIQFALNISFGCHRWVHAVGSASADPEHTGGNEAVSRAGTYVRLIDTFDPRGQREAGIVAHVNVHDHEAPGG